jgi:hypothetical protein
MTKHGLFPPIENLLLPYHLDQCPFFPATVKFTVKVLPRPEVKLAVSNRNHDLPAHNLPLQMRVSIIFTDIMAILLHWLVRSQLFQPHLKILVEPGLIVINKHRGGVEHGIHKITLVMA